MLPGNQLLSFCACYILTMINLKVNGAALILLGSKVKLQADPAWGLPTQCAGLIFPFSSPFLLELEPRMTGWRWGGGRWAQKVKGNESVPEPRPPKEVQEGWMQSFAFSLEKRNPLHNFRLNHKEHTWKRFGRFESLVNCKLNKLKIL